MNFFDLELGAPRTGGSGNAGSFYHVSFRSGSRATGACAVSAHDYIAREHVFDSTAFDRAVHVESGHLPSWTQGDAREYWDAADLYERENGRLFVAGDFALPRGLELEEQIALAREFVSGLTDREHLPYTFAIHAGEDRGGQEHNPHVHVMISERGNDGIDRDRQQWFRRANRAHPERGGVAKSRAFHGRDWVEGARERLADSINARLREDGRQERVDHRSYERQGVDRQPAEHFGPEAAHIFERRGESDRLEYAAAVDDIPRQLADVEQQIEELERVHRSLVLEQESFKRTHDRSPTRLSSHTYSPDDGSPER
jgi:hypothetical protein